MPWTQTRGCSPRRAASGERQGRCRSSRGRTRGRPAWREPPRCRTPPNCGWIPQAIPRRSGTSSVVNNALEPVRTSRAGSARRSCPDRHVGRGAVQPQVRERRPHDGTMLTPARERLRPVLRRRALDRGATDDRPRLGDPTELAHSPPPGLCGTQRREVGARGRLRVPLTVLPESDHGNGSTSVSSQRSGNPAHCAEGAGEECDSLPSAWAEPVGVSG